MPRIFLLRYFLLVSASQKMFVKNFSSKMLSQAMIFPFQDFLTKSCVTSVLHEETEARHLCSFLRLISGQEVVKDLLVVLADIIIETSEDLVLTLWIPWFSFCCREVLAWWCFLLKFHWADRREKIFVVCAAGPLSVEQSRTPTKDDVQWDEGFSRGSVSSQSEVRWICFDISLNI